MAEATDSTDYRAQIDKACRIYADLGFSMQRIAAQLIRSGYPPELVRARFPDLPVSALPEPPSSRALDRSRKAPRETPAPIGRLLPQAQRLVVEPAAPVPVP